MPVRSASAIWEGGLRGGHGTMKFGGGAYVGAYSFASRFEEGAGTNPEELIAAAHAGCFSMALAGAMEGKGTAPRRIQTTARVTIQKSPEGFTITESALETEVQAPGWNEQDFSQVADGAKKGCPVSRALGGTKITLTARLAP